jgi:protein CpxP
MAVCLGSALQAQTPDVSPSASPGNGVEEHGGWRHHGGGLYKQLNLTASQRQQLKSYRANNQAAFRSAKLASLQAKQALENAISQNNTANLAGLASNLATAQTQLIQLRAQREAYLVSILTPEQKSVWNEIQSKQQNRVQDRIDELQEQ